MTTVNGLFTAGDGVGCSGHKFSSGSHAEGRIAAKQLVRFAKDHADFNRLPSKAPRIVDLVYKPVRCTWKTATPRRRFNPNYIKPNGMMYRMMKATHEYGAGTATFYRPAARTWRS